MMRPLVDEGRVELIFEPSDFTEPFDSDEGKISQILRNFISNALKFTEHGAVRVSATYDAQLDTIAFAVADTGIGISPDNLQLIFEEFSQIEHPLQRRSKGTGLGLYLARELCLNNDAKLDYEYRFDPTATGPRRASGRFVISFSQPA